MSIKANELFSLTKGKGRKSSSFNLGKQVHRVTVGRVSTWGINHELAFMTVIIQ